MIGKKVYVVDWGKHYRDLTRWENNKKVNIFPIKTELPDYCGIDYHWEFIYEPNYTLKGTVNKKEPKKLVDKIPKYKNYKWEVIEVFKHPKAGEWYYPERSDKEEYGKFTENNLLLLASTHTDKEWMKCYILIEESGVSNLTPEQYADANFNAIISANLGKWNRLQINPSKDIDKIPKEIKSVFYDANDNVLFGSCMTKGLVSYHYIDGKFSTDGKPIYLGSSVLYDGKGNSEVKDKNLIKPFNIIKNYLEN